MKLLTQDKDVEVLESEKMYDLLQFRRAVVEERYEVCGFWMLQARKNGVTFYEMALIILKKHVAEKRAREWLKTRTA